MFTLLGMKYEVKQASVFKIAPTALGPQGFLNGWVEEHGFELVTLVPTDDDWLIVLQTE